MSSAEAEYTHLIEAIAARLARIDDQPLDDARLSAILMLDRARQHYRRNGTPYGDTVAGFLKWWFEQF